jgi:hypothetical protein
MIHIILEAKVQHIGAAWCSDADGTVLSSKELGVVNK